ncbi:MAG: TRAP transporter substrate-binding protein DctP [Parasporobacterium sp.]|nr:TRAP transporter substrate-binding protein DctP [Parasporobacterium sp.]
MKKTVISLAAAAVLTASMTATAFAGEAIAPDTFTLTTTFSENEYCGEILTHLNEELQTLSDGALSLDIYWGGTVAGAGEELAFVGEGGLDMTVIGQSQYTSVLPLLNFPSQVITSYEDSINLIDSIAFTNEKTKDFVQAEIESNNVHMIGSMPGGTNAFITKTEYKSIDEMKGLKLGIGMNQSAMESLGFNVVTMMPWDYYDQLSRGVADAGYMSISALISMSLQEVTPFFLADGTYTAGNIITMNLDRWNALSDAAKAVFEQAVANTQKYACEIAVNMDADAETKIIEAGGALNKLGAEDAARVQQAFFTTGTGDARGYALSAGKTDEMEVILAEVAAYIGLDVPDTAATVAADAGDSEGGESAEGESADGESAAE